MPILVIKVAEPNSPMKDTAPSIAGHAWLSLEKEGVATQSIGFGRKDDSFFTGEKYNDDDINYLVYHELRIDISEDQYQKLIDFYNNPPAYGFDSSSYNVVTNSCVDFVWKALEVAGLNPDGFEGLPVPVSNLAAFNLLRDPRLSVGGDPATGLDWPGATAFESIRSDFKRITTLGSPVILDLDGDGVETIDMSTSGVFFDHDKNKFAELSGWVGKDDGLLVRDLNNNGRIDNGGELFGSNTVLGSANAANGFDALAALDSNQDGAFSSADSAWAQVKVWKDGNSNAMVDAGEMLTLQQAGVSKINLGYTYTWQTDGSGNLHRETTSYVNTQGETRTATDVWFQTDLMYTKNLDRLAVSPEVAGMLFLKGAGNLPDLHQALMRDSSGVLKAKVANLSAQLNGSASLPMLSASLLDVMFHWAGVESTPVGKYGPSIDARHAALVEKFVGENVADLMGGASHLGPQQAGTVEVAFLKLFTLHMASAFEKTRFKPVLEAVQFKTDASTGQLTFDFAQATQLLQSMVSGLPSDDKAMYLSFFKAVFNQYSVEGRDEILSLITSEVLKSTDASFKQAWSIACDVVGISTSAYQSLDFGASASSVMYIGGEGNDSIYGSNANDVLIGQEGEDYLSGGFGNDTLTGSSGNDYLSGDDGDDRLEGGTGNDVISGSSGNDTYVFGKGDGQDYIYSDFDSNTARINTLQLKTGVLPSELNLQASGQDLVIKINGTADQITVGGFFSHGTTSGMYNPLQQIKFADGTTWNLATMLSKHLAATTGDDSLQGTQASETINSQTGNDTVYAAGGNDTINGGDGNDYLYGDEGTDNLNGGAHDDYLSGGFGNDTLTGSSGNDYLFGDDGDDRLDGGTGNDVISGSSGNDTYVFGKGDGQDYIYSDFDGNTARINTLQLKTGVLPSELNLQASGQDLVIKINGTTDQITVNGFFYGGTTSSMYNPLQQVKFADGTTWNLATIQSKHLAATSGDDSLQGTQTSETINSLAGNDTVYGAGGNDTINGGDGNDYLYSDGGADNLNGGGHDDYLSSGGGNDTLSGSSGNDYLSGGDGDDRLEGGTGNDVLSGDHGNDTYVFGKGDGQDFIYADYYDSSATRINTLQLKAGVLPSELNLQASSQDLVIKINGTADQITVGGFFSHGTTSGMYNPLQQIKFADGTTWNLATMLSKHLAATTGDDSLQGTQASETINSQAGNDMVYAAGGNDTINGGDGNDYLYGDEGTDNLNGGAHDDYLSGGAGNDTLSGSSGNDYLYGDNGNDRLDGGAGTDGMRGGLGNDTYVFGRGYGLDVISDYDSSAGKLDAIAFNSGVLQSDILVSRSSSDLLLSIKGTSDTIRVSNHFSSTGNNPYDIDRVTFADGTFWDQNKINSLVVGSTTA